MDVILGGYLETGLVRYFDAVLQPDRNRTSHPYYLGLNRKVAKTYFDRSATFVSIADRIVIPSIDWGPFRSDHLTFDPAILGMDLNPEEEPGGREWDDDAVAFAEVLLANKVLSLESWRHASTLDLSEHDQESLTRIGQRRAELEHKIAHHFLCRLLLQIRAASATGAFLVLAENDLQILKEIGQFLLTSRAPSPHPLPDLTGQVFSGEDFAGGLLNFAPPDALALVAVKKDETVRRYADKLASVIGETSTEASQRGLLQAMREAHEKAEAGRKAETVFEISSWIAKPLHYVPVLGELLSVAEDAQDLMAAWAKRETERQEWCLIGVRMTEIAYKDYLARHHNQM